LHLIAQRGLKIWPDSDAKKSKLEVVNCRFIGFADTGVTHQMVSELFATIVKTGLDIAAINSLYTYDDSIGFTLAQGE